MTYDEETGTYKPIFGYKSRQSEDDWVKEVKANDDPMVDLYQKARDDKKKRIQEIQT